MQITGSVACPFGQLSYQHYDDAVPAGVTAALKLPLLRGTLLAEGHSALRTLDLTYRYKVSTGPLPHTTAGRSAGGRLRAPGQAPLRTGPRIY